MHQAADPLKLFWFATPISQEEKLELLPELKRKLAKNIATAGKTGELNFMMEGLTYFPMGVFQEEVGEEGRGSLCQIKGEGCCSKWGHGCEP